MKCVLFFIIFASNIEYDNQFSSIMDKKTAKRTYTNKEISVFWDAGLCVHAAICFVELPDVFSPRRRPWIDLSLGTTDEIIRIVNACPTMALSFRWHDAEKNKTETSLKLKPETPATETDPCPDLPKSGAVVKIDPKGPVIIKGNFDLIDENGVRTEASKTVCLCRCGRSRAMPFCDGTHVYAGNTE